jgi:hypothetical protein
MPSSRLAKPLAVQPDAIFIKAHYHPLALKSDDAENLI